MNTTLKLAIVVGVLASAALLYRRRSTNTEPTDAPTTGAADTDTTATRTATAATGD